MAPGIPSNHGSPDKILEWGRNGAACCNRKMKHKRHGGSYNKSGSSEPVLSVELDCPPFMTQLTTMPIPQRCSFLMPVRVNDIAVFHHLQSRIPKYISSSHDSTHRFPYSLIPSPLQLNPSLHPIAILLHIPPPIRPPKSQKSNNPLYIKIETFLGIIFDKWEGRKRCESDFWLNAGLCPVAVLQSSGDLGQEVKLLFGLNFEVDLGNDGAEEGSVLGREMG